MPDELEERLRIHARSFDSLLSLIPAKLYYGEDVSDQWKRKKQTPEQKRAAKMAKLDPDNWKSAKDVLDERAAAAKRKRDEEDDDIVLPKDLHVEPEKPKVVQDQERKHKKQKLGNTPDHASTIPKAQAQTLTTEEKKIQNAEKKAAKQLAKQKLKDKKQKQKDRKAQARATSNQEDDEWIDVNEEGIETAQSVNLDLPELKMLDSQIVDDNASTASSSTDMMDIMSPPAESGTSSISSIQAEQPTLSLEATPKPKSKSKISGLSAVQINLTQSTIAPQPAAEHDHSVKSKSNDADKTAARDRLSAAISSFRNQRKADTNPRSRQDLLNARRLKEEARRTAKKEQRRKEREEETRLADEEIERRFSPGGSGSLLGSPRSPSTQQNHEDSNSFSFGRIAFGDGSEVDPALSNSLVNKQKKGPQDANTALQAVKNKHSRLAGLDGDKRKLIEEKDMWLNAKKRAHGERVKDDTSLLKKALKRQEVQKKKSEREWTDRKDGIQKAQEAKQKKRTENLAKRKDERKHGKKAGSKGKQVKRPGFEGSFRGRTGGTKKSSK